MKEYCFVPDPLLLTPERSIPFEDRVRFNQWPF